MATISRGHDGKYRWVYEMNLYTNPTVLFVVLKIFFCICVGIWVFMNVIELFSSDVFWDAFLVNTKFFGIFTVFFLALCTLGYYIYALINGGKYCVLFEMDDDGVLHKQMPQGVKKANLIGAITAMAGAATGNLTTTIIGRNAAARTQMYTSFASVKSVEVFRRRNLIKVNAPLNYNQVYADDGDFDFVLNHILRHITPQATPRPN